MLRSAGDGEVHHRVVELALRLPRAVIAEELLLGCTEVHRTLVGAPVLPVPHPVAELDSSGPSHAGPRCPGSDHELQALLRITRFGSGPRHRTMCLSASESDGYSSGGNPNAPKK